MYCWDEDGNKTKIVKQESYTHSCVDNKGDVSRCLLLKSLSGCDETGANN